MICNSSPERRKTGEGARRRKEERRKTGEGDSRVKRREGKEEEREQ